MHVVPLEVASLGNRCHLVHDGSTALVVDPPRDVATVERLAEDEQVDIAAVADTHVHNDYVSGALALARRHGADYLLSKDEPVHFERVGVRDGDHLEVGRLDVRVLATPGHTRHHQSFHVTDGRGPGALLSGGSLLHGTVGRTDLVDDRLTADLARAQWASARRLAQLDPATRLLPTHGFGSFCASTTAAPDGGGTLADQLVANSALRQERDAFVADLLAGFGPVPAYYAHMAPLNRVGAGQHQPRSGRPLTTPELADAAAAGAWVVDARSRADFAAAHLTGSVNIEYGAQFATYVGWLVPWQADIVVLTDRSHALTDLQRDLARIGIDGIGTHLLDATDPLAGDPAYRRSDWAGFREAVATSAEAPVVVDVRQRDEYDAGHLTDAHHVPVQEVLARGDQLPGGELWVHCRSGYRAGIAASLLHRSGRRVVHVDDDWARVAELDLPVTGLAA